MESRGPAPSPAVSACRACGSSDLTTVLDFGPQPAADHFPAQEDPGPDPLWPLAVLLCGGCGLAQLGHESPAEELPRAVESATAIAHAAAMAADAVRRLAVTPGQTVLEYHSNHGGAWQSHLVDLGMRPIPVESAADNSADLVIDNHGIVHNEDFAQTLGARLRKVAPDGHYLIEFHHLLRMITDSQFDTIRHGHPVYLTVSVLQQALAGFGFSVLDVAEVDLYGGCVVLTAGRFGEASDRVAKLIAAEREAGVASADRWREFADSAHASCRAIKDWLVDLRASGVSVLGYGAPSKASLLLSAAGVGPELLPATADLSPAKQGRRVSGSGVPIISPDELRAAAPAYVLVLTWDIAPEIVGGYRDLVAAGTRFFSPIPYLHEIKASPTSAGNLPQR